VKLLLFLLILAAAGGAYYAFQQIDQQEADYRQKVQGLTSEVDQMTAENKGRAADYDQLSQSLLSTRQQINDLTPKLYACQEAMKEFHPAPPPVAPVPVPVRPAPVAKAPAPPVVAVVAPTDPFASDQADQPELPARWRYILKIAKDFVDKESPASVWPFERLSPKDRAQSPSKVFSHYFLPFPLSIGNQPVDSDYYTKGYLAPEGEGGKHLASGGFLRERPLSPGPWESPDWNQINFAIEILRAQRMGIDGFSCDLLSVSPGTLWDRMMQLFDTAAAIAPDFRIMIMPDMESELKRHPEKLEDVLFQLAQKPSAYKLADGRLVVAPFNAQKQPPDFWKDSFARLKARGVDVAFLPVFQGWQRYARDYAPLCYGLSDWGQRDLVAAKGMAQAGVAAADFTRVWMMPVAPQDMRPKDGIYWEAGNTGAYRELWSGAITTRSALVQLITWNDYSEHAEVSPSSGTQFLFYDLGAYYTDWLKSGHPPRIVSDAIYYCHRRQILPLVAPPAKQSLRFKVYGPTSQMNQIEMIAFLTAPATLEIELGGEVHRHEAGAGLVIFSIPAATGQPDFRIVRDKATVAEVRSAWPIVDHADIEDPLYRGGSSNRPFVPVGKPDNQ
jgi:hypothetical protein